VVLLHALVAFVLAHSVFVLMEFEAVMLRGFQAIVLTAFMLFFFFMLFTHLKILSLVFTAVVHFRESFGKTGAAAKRTTGFGGLEDFRARDLFALGNA
jgi:hypothetical protein